MSQKTQERQEDLNNTVEHFDLTSMWRTLHARTSGYTFFSSVPATFTEILMTILSNNHGIEWEINNNK